MTVIDPPETADLDGLSVLIIDDDYQIVDYASLVITGAGGTAHGVHSAAEGRATLDNRAIDVIIVDLVMPGTTGRTLLDSLLLSHPTLPAIAISGVPEQGARAALRSNVLATLDKPFTAAQLLAAVALAAGRAAG